MNTNCETIAVADLDSSERFWLWAIRSWSSCYSDLTCVWWSLDRAFNSEEISKALLPFHEMMTVLFAEVRYWPEIRCVIYPKMSDDETRLLDVFIELQRGDEFGARTSLQRWVPRSVARVACGHAEHCVAIATSAGFTLKRRDTSSQRSALRST